MRVFPTRKREALLTFDLGPDQDQDAHRVLDLLEQHGAARALFFVSGLQARQHPELIREITARGHGLGLHGMSNANSVFTCRTPDHSRREIARLCRS